jgi:hypothetical protein
MLAVLEAGADGPCHVTLGMAWAGVPAQPLPGMSLAWLQTLVHAAVPAAPPPVVLAWPAVIHPLDDALARARSCAIAAAASITEGRPWAALLMDTEGVWTHHPGWQSGAELLRAMVAPGAVPVVGAVLGLPSTPLASSAAVAAADDDADGPDDLIRWLAASMDTHALRVWPWPCAVGGARR